MISLENRLSPRVRDPEYTGALAHLALRSIEQMDLPADPPSFELWYTHFGKTNPALSKAIGEIVASRGRVSLSELDQLYDRYFRVDVRERRSQTTQVSHEIDELIALFERSLKSLANNERGLSFAVERLDEAKTPSSIRLIADRMVEMLRLAQSDNGQLMSSLETSRTRIADLQRSIEALQAESITDALTQLANRSHFDASLARLLNDPSAEALSLLMVDVDHFKQFNDRHGHLLGDDVLRLVSKVIRDSIRHCDLGARYGGDEFAVILPGTPLEGAIIVARKIHDGIAGRDLIRRTTGEGLGQVTVSIGVAESRLHDHSQKLIERTDKCLYDAKRQGRNQVVAERQDEFRDRRPPGAR